MITVTTPAETFDLTTVAAVRAELEIVDNAQDAKLQTLISQASGIISAHCKRVFAAETVAETFRPDRLQEYLILGRYPVSSISSIVENGAALAEYDYELDGGGGILIRLNDDNPCSWPRGKIVVTYVAGFALVGDLPFGVERACIQLVKAYALGFDRDPMISSETSDNISSVSYLRGAEHLPPDVRGLLKPHRNYRTR